MTDFYLYGRIYLVGFVLSLFIGALCGGVADEDADIGSVLAFAALWPLVMPIALGHIGHCLFTGKKL
jgi:hypothetical protein